MLVDQLHCSTLQLKLHPLGVLRFSLKRVKFVHTSSHIKYLVSFLILNIIIIIFFYNKSVQDRHRKTIIPDKWSKNAVRSPLYINTKQKV